MTDFQNESILGKQIGKTIINVILHFVPVETLYVFARSKIRIILYYSRSNIRIILCYSGLKIIIVLCFFAVED